MTNTTSISEFARQTEPEITKEDVLCPVFEFYPENRELFDNNAFYVQFHSWGADKETTWQLFRRQYRCSKEEYLKDCQIVGIEPFSEMSEWRLGGSVEVHPWNLGEGILVDKKNENAVSLHTKKFLHFMVDALNEKAFKRKTANSK